jgi:hypothetical protein
MAMEHKPSAREEFTEFKQTVFFQQLKEALLADLGTTQEEEEHLLKLMYGIYRYSKEPQ